MFFAGHTRSWDGWLQMFSSTGKMLAKDFMNQAAASPAISG
jgi:hypothetical protein